LVHDLRHRAHVSWHGAAGTWGRAVQCVLSLAALVWVATRTPRRRIVDSFLVGIVVSLLVNDTPQDVLFWGAVTGVGLRRSVWRWPPCPPRAAWPRLSSSRRCCSRRPPARARSPAGGRQPPCRRR